ncbi:MAG: YfhO family protein, partial [Bacteroidia bacterium]|nr:YfhO family protein [Bacteroidia bacterium]
NGALLILNKCCQCFLPQPMGIVFLYFLGFFILMLCLKIDPWLGIVGSIAFGFSSYLFVILQAGHNTQAVAVGYAPALLGGVILLFRQKWLAGFLVTTLFMGLELYANHPQITYYLFLLIGLYLIGEFIGFLIEKKFKDFLKAVALLIVALTIGTLPNIGNLWTTAEYGKYTTRGPSELTIQADGKKNVETAALKLDYITDYSYGVGESFSLLISNFKGGPPSERISSQPKLMDGVDDQYREDVERSGFYFADTTPVYAGCLIVLLSIAGMFIIKNRIKWPLLVTSLFALTLAWGRNFQTLTDFFFTYFPAYNKFRGVSMLMIVVEMVLPILAILTLNQLIEEHGENLKEKIKNRLYLRKLALLITSGVIVLFLLINLMAPRAFNTFHSEDEDTEVYIQRAKPQILQKFRQENPTASLEEANNAVNSQMSQYRQGYSKYLQELEKPRIAYVKKDVLRTLMIVLLGGGLVLAFVYTRMNKIILIAGVGLLVLIDLWTVNVRHFNKDSYTEKRPQEEEFQMSRADAAILNDTVAKDFRVLGYQYQNPFNDGAFSYYHKSIGGYHGAKLKKYQELIEFHLRREADFSAQIADAGMPDSIATMYMNKQTPVLNMLNMRYVLTSRNFDESNPKFDPNPFMNKAANGNAWFVSKIRWAPNADSEIVWTGNIDTKTTAVINEKFKEQLKGSEGIAATWANVKLTDYKPNHLQYSYESKSKQLIVFSEVYYPAGWNAYVDGVLTPHVAANYVLRAMMVPEGNHKIEFKFEPKSFLTGEKISFAGVIIYYIVLIGGLAYLIFKAVKTKK